MSIKVYPDKKTKARLETSRSFAGCTPMEAAIEQGMERMTLEQLGKQLQRQLAASGAVGITLIGVRFAMIIEPSTIKASW